MYYKPKQDCVRCPFKVNKYFFTDMNGLLYWEWEIQKCERPMETLGHEPLMASGLQCSCTGCMSIFTTLCICNIWRHCSQPPQSLSICKKRWTSACEWCVDVSLWVVRKTSKSTFSEQVHLPLRIHTTSHRLYFLPMTSHLLFFCSLFLLPFAECEEEEIRLFAQQMVRLSHLRFSQYLLSIELCMPSAVCCFIPSVHQYLPCYCWM